VVCFKVIKIRSKITRFHDLVHPLPSGSCTKSFSEQNHSKIAPQIMISHATVQEGGQFVLSAFSSVTIFCKKKIGWG
jgi:hypothetical protein